MKHLTYILLFLLSTSCILPKTERAKNRINKIIAKHPELKSVTVQTDTLRDTVISTSAINIEDTLYSKHMSFDTTFYNSDSILRIALDELSAMFVRTDQGIKVRVVKVPELIKYDSTIIIRDTIVNTIIETTKTDVINTKPNWFIRWLYGSWWWLLIVLILVLFTYAFIKLKISKK